MGSIIACTKGGKEPIYIAPNIEDLIGLKPEQVMALPSLESVAPNLDFSQKKFQQELAKPHGRFHSYTYRSELRRADGTTLAIEHTVLIIDPGLNSDVLTVSVMRPICSCGERMAELWPRLSAESRRLVFNITEALAGL